MTQYVDFDEYEDQTNPKASEQTANNMNMNMNMNTLYMRDGKPVNFDHTTMEYYRTMRKLKMDPIMLQELPDNICFKFPYQWNPLTGERLGLDPYGPLCFHPDVLIKYFYTNRLNDIWTPESQDGFQGSYGDAVGAGEDIYIQSRGYHPEKYVFRLPIIDCYWPDDTPNKTIITFGPKLTDEEVKQIDTLAAKCGAYPYYSTRPSLATMKRLYDNALSKVPIVPGIDLTSLSQPERIEKYNAENRRCVDQLRKTRG